MSNKHTRSISMPSRQDFRRQRMDVVNQAVQHWLLAAEQAVQHCHPFAKARVACAATTASMDLLGEQPRMRKALLVEFAA